MKKTFTYTPQYVCSRQMNIVYEDDTIVDFKVVGGCHGNLQGITALIKGMKIDDVINKLSGINCHGRGTSCPDQLAKALTQLKAQNLEGRK
ncbi:MAG: TIGR03905 family TSCPD domain-containing protein [Bacilli bacterium]|nr:TIGR03905 family TSCPD domain-containing protein [Bacilli bacterium]